MNQNLQQTEKSLENDPVWKLLDQAPPATAGPRFTDDTLRAARLAGQKNSWWKHLLTPAPLAGFATATAALVLSLNVWLTPETSTPQDPVVAAIDSPQAAAIQEFAETEALIAAVDHLDEFSDTELVALIGF
ncbi:MAG: hypothetical protein Q7R22_011295 [Verrucomicrobiota bacterium JB025]|nr:hypothetical protein [Verrucomicrobiota bacterium JB025]